MAANRFPGIRASLGWNVQAAQAARNDEDSNILSLPSAVFQTEEWKKIIDTWLKTPFAKAERYIRRNKELDELVQ